MGPPSCAGLLAWEHGSEVPIRGDLLASWVRTILQATDPNMGSGITGHSAKATCLSWCAKANLGMDTRTILGPTLFGWPQICGRL